MPVHDFEYVNLQMEIGTIAGWGYDAYAQQYKNGRLKFLLKQTQSQVGLEGLAFIDLDSTDSMTIS